MPAGCPLTDEAEVDQDVWLVLFNLDYYLRLTEAQIRQRAERSPGLGRAVERCKLLAAENPGLAERTLWGGRRFDVLHFLLSRLVSPGQRVWIDLALGMMRPSPALRPTPWANTYRFSAEEAGNIHWTLETVPVERLVEAWNAPAMQAAQVYEAPGENEVISQYVLEDFQALKHFYALAWEHREEVISRLF